MLNNNAPQAEATPLDEIISQVEMYLSDPTQVTPETLQTLRDSLVDLKTFVDGEDASPNDGYNDTKDQADMPPIMGALKNVNRMEEE